ncbi:MAG TPA: anti-sigma factor [Opitutaceae bacterium]|nr:anti-sigma factor [Opitutaceae bacterium]
MIAERHEELAALYALDLLAGADRTQFEAELAADPALRALVAELRDSAAALAHAAPPAGPPAALRERLLRSVETRTVSRSKEDEKILRPPPSIFRALLPWAVAACFALAAGWLGQLYLSSRTEAALLRDEKTFAELALQSARNQLEAERIVNGQRFATLDRELKAQGDLANFKIAALTSMLNNSPQALAVAVWNPAQQQGVLQVEKLPALAADKDYQLWVVDPAYPNPVDGGTFTVDPQSGAQRVTFHPRQPIKAVNAFAVTLERKGGVPKAEGPFVLFGK